MADCVKEKEKESEKKARSCASSSGKTVSASNKAGKEGNGNIDKPKKDEARKEKSKNGNNNDDSSVLELLKIIRSDQHRLVNRIDEMESRLDGYEECYEYDTMDYQEHGIDHNIGELENESMDGAMASNLPSTCSMASNNAPSMSIFQKFASKFSNDETTSQEVDPVFAMTINDMFRKGLSEDVFENMVKDENCARPKNCDGLAIVKMNKLIWDVISSKARNNDKKLQTVEKSIVKAGVKLTKSMSAMAGKLQCDGDNEVLDQLNDILAILGHANVQINMARRDLLRPELRQEYAHLCNHSYPFTNELFGDDVSKTAKEIEDCNKMGTRLQYGYGQKQRGRVMFRRFGARRSPYGRGYTAYNPGFNRSMPPKNTRGRGAQRRP